MAVDCTFSLVVDHGKKSQQFILENHGSRVEHFIGTTKEVLNGRGYCHTCKHTHDIKLAGCDVRIFSPPCPPFSALRNSSGSTPSTGPCTEHPDFSTTFDDVVEMTELDPPLVTFVEQVANFNKHNSKLGQSPCQMMVKLLEKIYGHGHVEVVQLNSSLWIEGSRPRCPA